jgi:hypothetical protein
MSSFTAKDRVSLCSFTFPALFCPSTIPNFREAHPRVDMPRSTFRCPDRRT